MTEPIHVAVAAVAQPIHEFVSRSADLVLITRGDDDSPRAIPAGLADLGRAGLKVFAGPYVPSSGSSAHRANETLRARLRLPVAENRYQEANQP